MPCAYNLTRREVHYRHESFNAGLKAAGFALPPGDPKGAPGDVLLIWNRYWHYDQIATAFEAKGGTVIVAENGYIGRDANGHQLYALARGGHNGSGSWPDGGPERFDALGVELKPWRERGDKVVIRGQRGIGSPTMASPPRWHEAMAARLHACGRPVQVVPHPGKGAEADRAHEDYLADAHALVIWSSSVGVKALAMGVPVFVDAPHWICEGAAARLGDVEHPLMDDAARLAAMRRMAWAQWSLAEIESGEPFVRLAS